MAITPLSTDVILGWASTRTGSGASASASSNSSKAGVGVKAPWENIAKQTPASALVTLGLSGKAVFDAKKDFAVPGATADEKKLFALHAGLNTLAALAGRYDQTGVTTAEQARLSAAFDAGLKQLDSFLATQKFDAISVLRGAKANQAVSEAGVAGVKTSYSTGVIAKGDPDAANAAFAGDLAFHVDAVDTSGAAKSIDIDLADMGATPRSLNAVTNFINSKLRANGLLGQFSAVKGAKTNGLDEYSLKLSIPTGEKFTFSAVATAPAIYMAGGANGLVKIADPAGGVTTGGIGASNAVFDKIIAKDSTIRASAVGADGALYVLADATKIAGQPVKGASDVALYKYDSAGNVVYTRTLGAAGAASGFALAIADDGKVAVTGSVTGSLSDGQKASATAADSFVTLYDSAGVEQWTVRDKVSRDDENTAVAFGADGTVYVGGRQKTLAGDWDATLKTYSDEGVLRDTKTFATSGDEGVQALVVEDNGGTQRVTMANVESGRAVLRQFDDDGVAVATGAVRDLGTLGGGNLAGLKLDGGELYLAGNTKVGGLDVGNVARAYSGGQDGFVVKLSGDLTAGAGDRVSYVGGTGDDRIAGFGVSGGEIWFGGDSDEAFGGQAELRDRDGFVGRLDANGDVAWLQRFASGKEAFSAKSFAFDQTGASALDRLGLPQGTIQTKDVKDLISGTSLRVGDQFSLSVNGRTPQIIKIAADDTLQKLADRINRALLSGGKASLSLSTVEGDKLKIVATGTNKIELRAGPAGKDALDGLGINEGVVIIDTPVTSKNKKAIPIYGLGLSSTMSLADKAGRKEAVDDLGAALSAVQKAFKTLANPASDKPAVNGPAPAYLQKQLANYTAALARLSG